MNPIYIGLTGAVARDRQLDAVAHNLANVSTNGFKRERIAFESLLMGQDAEGVGNTTAASDMSDGPLVATGRALDLALQGDGMVAVRGSGGERYVRGGSLVVNGKGELALATGEVVVAETGRTLQVGVGNDAHLGFTPKGEVLVDGAPVGQIRLRSFARPDLLVREGGSLFRAPPAAGARPATPEVHGGTVERSNSDPTRGLVEMIRLQRAYDAQVELMKQRDELTRTTVDQVGEVAR